MTHYDPIFRTQIYADRDKENGKGKREGGKDEKGEHNGVQLLFSIFHFPSSASISVHQRHQRSIYPHKTISVPFGEEP